MLLDYFGQEATWAALGAMQGVKGVLSFLSAPSLGHLSDVYGRKKFILLTVTSTLLPLPFLLFSVWWHVVATALSGAFAVTFTIAFAYVSDITEGAERSAAFGVVSATFAASIVVSPAIGGWIQSEYGTDAVYYAASGVAVAAVIYVVLFVPESLPVGREIGSVSCARLSPFSAIRVMCDSALMTKLCLMVFFSYLPETGEQQSLLMYLESTVDFSKTDLATFIAALGIASILAQTLFLKWAAHRISQKKIITLGLVFLAVQLSIFGCFSAKWILFLNVIPTAMGSITYPAISSLLSHASSPEEQGQVQGMVTGVRALCTGLGPALFGALFQLGEMRSTATVAEDGTDAGIMGEGDEPRDTGALYDRSEGLPFIVGVCFVVIAIIINVSIQDEVARRPSAMSFSPGKSSNLDLHGLEDVKCDTVSRDMQTSRPASPDFEDA